jgi:SsrA-binding protein
MNMHKSSSKKTVAQNRRARFDYEIKDTYEAGIVLKGYEVKSAANGQISLKESFVRIEKEEAWLINAHITKWKFANIPNYDPCARRKLLLKKGEIRELEIAQDAKNMSIIPLKMFLQRGKLKLKIGIGKGRKKYDKRRKIRERESKRQVKEDLARVRKF